MNILGYFLLSETLRKSNTLKSENAFLLILPSEMESLVERSYTSDPKYTQIRPGLPEDYKNIKTLGDLLSVNYKLLSSREQIRQNLISLKQEEKPCYPGIIGFDDDVVPALDRALLSGHDVFLIGQIGQAKTKLIQTISENLLSPIPIIKDSLTNDSPMDLPKEQLATILDGNNPQSQSPIFYVSPESLDILGEKKLETPIVWREGKFRYKYVLATPDISVKDLVGYIDAIKVAKKGIEMYKIDSYSPGQLMQAKHGIFCIDELPVLDPRKQVSLLSVLQEGRFTTGAYPVIFEPKTMFFATANPIDYTHSGRVIEPLFDRLKSHIHTHYPKSIKDEMMIILQEAKIPRSLIPEFLLKTLATLVHKMRKSEQINQERGVSVRLGIHGLEILVGEAQRTRTLKHGLVPVPRLSDFHSLEQIAKFELSELDDTVPNRAKIFGELVNESIKEISKKFLENVQETTLQSIKAEFGESAFPASQQMVWKNGEASYAVQVEKIPSLKSLIEVKLKLIKDIQDDLIEKTTSAGIDSKTIAISEDAYDELHSSVTELLLEGLCWITPKILDRRDAGYVHA